MLPAIAVSAVVGGFVCAILWVVLWSLAFPDAWPGYDAFTVRIFLAGALGGGVLPILDMR